MVVGSYFTSNYNRVLLLFIIATSFAREKPVIGPSNRMLPQQKSTLWFGFNQLLLLAREMIQQPIPPIKHSFFLFSDYIVDVKRLLKLLDILR